MPLSLGHRRTVTLGPDPITNPIGVEMGVPYTLINPDGWRAVINDPTDRDFVGYLTEPPSGLEGAGIREAADALPEADGGIHGAFWQDRMPFALTGIIFPDPQATAVLRMDKLKRASKALRADGQLLWTPTVSLIPVRVLFRSPNSIRLTNRRPKAFQVSGVSAQPWIESQDLLVAQGTAAFTATNLGGGTAYPLLTIYGPRTNPVVANTTYGGSLTFNVALATASDYLVVDTSPLRRSVRLQNVTNRYSALDFAASAWFGLGPGDNALTVSGSGSGLVTAQWRHTWG